MTTRQQSAAATRQALVVAAGELLDAGGPDAVTLRAVGARAGVSRGAPYGHFDNKEHLLTHLAIEAWDTLADEVDRLRADPSLAPIERVERGMLALLDTARRRPHLFALMFNTPVTKPEPAAAAQRLESRFLAIVSDLVGAEHAVRYGALLMSSAHGIAGMERGGHLGKAAWTVDAGDLARLLVSAIGRAVEDE